MKKKICILLACLILPNPAFAYLDPGSASLAVQAIIGLIISGLAVFGGIVQKTKKLVQMILIKFGIK